MNHIDQLEQTIQKNELAIRELAIQIDSMSDQVNSFLAELNVSPEQLSAYLANQDNFTQENWNTLLQQKQELEEKLKRELENIKNPLKTKKTYSERKIQQHWLYVR